mmetsp:Transcript_18666/g.21035  ORF Transcript_18666/g.21035 Transcript_18666/m.21035 type:complete len:771 (+) Transcript_18666:210-2522(+)
MGIKGLHKALSFCTVKDNLSSYRNKKIAVDTSSWIHRSVYSISEKFVEATDIERIDEQCVRVSARYIITRCKELVERYGISEIYLVMDGKRCPLKVDETQDREHKRQQNLKEARRFKRNGQRYKAEDKYKTCIRIRSEFTKAVIKYVENDFRNYQHGSIHMIFSPYEADSMLVKVVLDGFCDAVVTEDSDVLVYSAAAHKAFPILYKLDRGTGACDRISMDWLLSDSAEKKTQVTSSNTLEGILRRLASREAKRKGFGVRLFVQSCILAGSDYSINTLDGIGLIGAFKLVRDNAFRNDSVRFRKILLSLSKKIKQKIDISEYEERLAKSEAVFYYHPVKHTDGTIRPLLQPRISPEDVDEPFSTDHFPFMSRFQGDWSFLGTISSPRSSISIAIPNNSVDNSQSFQKEVSVVSKKRDFSHLFTKPKIVDNPYKKSSHTKRSRPLNERNVNSKVKYGEKTTVQNQTKAQIKNQGGCITKYFNKADPRITKKIFSSTTTRSDLGSKGLKRSRLSSSFQISRLSDCSKKKSPQRFIKTSGTTHKNNLAHFDYECASSDGTRVEVDQFDCHHGNYDKDINTFSYSSSNKTMPNSSFCDLTKSDSCDFGELSSFSPDSLAESGRPDTSFDQTKSSYFTTKSDPRRVTLDSSLGQSTLGDKLECSDGSSVVERNCWESDECIDDPDEEPKASPALCSYSGRRSPTKLTLSRIKTSRSRPDQPLHSFFNKRQEQFTNEIEKSSKTKSIASALTKKFQPKKNDTGLYSFLGKKPLGSK